MTMPMIARDVRVLFTVPVGQVLQSLQKYFTSISTSFMMLASQSVKRQRTNTIGAAVSAAILPAQFSDAPIISDHSTIISTLPEQIVRKLLALAAQKHQDVQTSIVNEISRIRAVEASKVIDFDHYSKSAWKIISITYSRYSGSRQYELSGEACNEITDIIDTIDNETPDHASLSTKKSALVTLRKIGKSLVLGPSDCLGSEIRKYFQWNSCLEKTMLRIAESMSPKERDRFWDQEQEFEDKLLELEELSNDYCMFENLGAVRLELLGADKSLGDDVEDGPEERDDGDDGSGDDEDGKDADDISNNNRPSVVR